MDQPGVEILSFFVVEGSGQEVPVSPFLGTHPAFIIGSDPRAQLRLDDPAAAPAHAVITRKESNYFVIARFPKLELHLNGKRLTIQAPLHAGDWIQIGATVLRFVQETRPVRVRPPARKPDAVFYPAVSGKGRSTHMPMPTDSTETANVR